jgi:hypothetical protein
MSRSISLSLLGLSIALCSSAAFADTVWLKNGDRLTGTIRFFDGSKLLLETDYGRSPRWRASMNCWSSSGR